MPLSSDLRERVVHAVEEGSSRSGTARRFGVSASSAIRWQERFEQDGRLEARPQGGDRRSHHVEEHAELILSLYAEEPTIFLSELKAVLAEHGIITSESGLSRFFKRHGITRKRMARPVGKRFVRGDLTGLRQRIRSRDHVPAKMEFRTPWSS